MKYIYVVIIPFLLLSLYGGCSNGGGSNELICGFQEALDRFSETDCIAEELVDGCSNIVCESIDGKDIIKGNFRNDCIVVDCETLECERIIVGSSDLFSGFLIELVIDEMNGLPAGVFVVDETESPFDCTFIAVE